MKKHFCSSLKYMSIFELTQTSPKPQLVSKSSCTSGLMQQNFRILNQGQIRCSGLGPGPGLGSESVYLPVCLFVCVFFSPFFNRYVSTNITYYKSLFLKWSILKFSFHTEATLTGTIYNLIPIVLSLVNRKRITQVSYRWRIQSSLWWS